jgi:hypothetical protein
MSAYYQLPDFASDEVNNYGEIHSSEQSIQSTTSSLCIQPHGKFDTFDDYVNNTLTLIHINRVTPQTHDFNRLQLNFGFVSPKHIQRLSRS